ncbi:MAG: hypothetical protein VKI82_06470 [Leptolyngbya sp.]|nr:hypothetical protein [Leptolyngbya sp.]
MLTSVHPDHQQRVAIAGTVINAATQEGLPQVVVHITHAPLACIQLFLEVLEESLVPYPYLMAHYQQWMADRPVSADTLKLAQAIFDTFERHQWLVMPRPDQALTGGDGHYCFFDLPPGDYGLTATLNIPNVCQGLTHGRVQVHPSDQRLAFSALDLTLSLLPCGVARSPHNLEDWRPWPGLSSLRQTQMALHRRD